MKIVLIACCSKKLASESIVKDLYISTLFKYSYLYAKQIKPDYIFVLSAKYGLLKMDDVIKPYNETLNKKSKSEKEEWANKVILQLKEYVNLDKDQVIFLAGLNYRKFLIDNIKRFDIPMIGLSIGKQLQYLRKQLDNTSN